MCKVNIPINTTVASYDVTIINDDFPEDNEVFTLEIDINQVRLSRMPPYRINITIIDDDHGE